MSLKKCIYCGFFLSGKQKKFCSPECGWIENNKRMNDKKLNKLAVKAKWEMVKNNSSNRAVTQIQKLMKDGRL